MVFHSQTAAAAAAAAAAADDDDDVDDYTPAICSFPNAIIRSAGVHLLVCRSTFCQQSSSNLSERRAALR